MKTYRLHKCDRAHRSERTFMDCAFPRAHWVIGSGSWAVLAWCGGLTVSLHPDRQRAFQAVFFIDGTGCGHACTRRHEVVRVDIGGPTRVACQGCTRTTTNRPAICDTCAAERATHSLQKRIARAQDLRDCLTKESKR